MKALMLIALAAASAAPPTPDELEIRGSDAFRASRFAESVGYFDQEIALDPRRGPWHWKRGISLYYAGRFAEGAKQFEGYQSVDGNDVENAVWRFLCQARDPDVGPAKARADILPIKNDRRVPMMHVYRMFRGELKPHDVFAAAKADAPDARALKVRMFYANLYVGLYEEIIQTGSSGERLEEAARAAIDHYMGDVAKVHATLLKNKN